MSKTKIIYPGGGKPSTTGKPSGPRRTTVIPSKPATKK
jgi:hypothetical protein